MDMRYEELVRSAAPFDRLTKEQVQKANSVARTAGYGSATSIILGSEDRVVYHISAGYRKRTTGEYVPHAYRAHFGWKNTYYQQAVTIVEIA